MTDQTRKAEAFTVERRGTLYDGEPPFYVAAPGERHTPIGGCFYATEEDARAAKKAREAAEEIAKYISNVCATAQGLAVQPDFYVAPMLEIIARHFPAPPAALSTPAAAPDGCFSGPFMDESDAAKVAREHIDAYTANAAGPMAINHQESPSVSVWRAGKLVAAAAIIRDDFNYSHVLLSAAPSSAPSPSAVDARAAFEATFGNPAGITSAMIAALWEPSTGMYRDDEIETYYGGWKSALAWQAALTHSAPGLTDALRDVSAERARQIGFEGWSPAHDDEHSRGEMALEIPDDVIEEVVTALKRAVGLAMHKAPDLAAGFTATAVRLDEAINDSLATKE